MSKVKGGSSVNRVWKIAEPIAKEQELEIWDIRFDKEGANWFLRIYIDKDEGINIEDCEKFSKAIDKPLDEEDPIVQSYCLEVRSPGVERELVRDEHFESCIDSDVKVKMIRGIDGIGREFSGVLKSYENGNATIEDYDKNNEITINKKDWVWIKLDVFG